MEFDWQNIPFDPGPLTLREIEESFEDPFAIRLMPDSKRFAVQARYFNLGVASTGVGIFSVFKTNGRQIRVICARPFEPEERYFYLKKMHESVSGKAE